MLKILAKNSFLKIPPLEKILEFQDRKKTRKLYKKENFKPEFKPVIENLQDEVFQLENKQAKHAKMGANVT